MVLSDDPNIRAELMALELGMARFLREPLLYPRRPQTRR
jgi:hypothetical protein